jgi:hypothetical protein
MFGFLFFYILTEILPLIKIQVREKVGISNKTYKKHEKFYIFF